MQNLKPHERKLIFSIYESLVGEPWFNRNAITERELIKVIFHHISAVGTDRQTLLERCSNEARKRFSRSR